jgi:hypothetical protein
MRDVSCGTFTEEDWTILLVDAKQIVATKMTTPLRKKFFILG